MSRFQVVIQPKAEAEAAEALAAFDWLADLRKAIAKLADNPTLHPLAVPASERFGFPIREALHGKHRGIYRILYAVEGDIISIPAIRHSARDELEP